MKCLFCGSVVEAIEVNGEHWRCSSCGFGCWTSGDGDRRYSYRGRGWTDIPEGTLYVFGEVGV